MKPLCIILFVLSFAQAQAQDYETYIKPLKDSVANVSVLLHHVRIGYKRGYDIDSLRQSYASLRKELLKAKIDYIKVHPGDSVALKVFDTEVVHGINALYCPPDSLMSLFSGFNRSQQESMRGKSLHAEIVKRQNLLLNKMMPDFAFKSLDGKQYQLSSFRGKYLLLGFWFNGCKGCAESFPIIKKLNEAYGDKLQMLSVSTDQLYEGWVNGLKRYQPTWMQTWDGKGYINGPSVESLYDVRYAPQYYLIDKDGKLIYHSTQSKDDDDYTVLKRMLKELLN